MLCRTGVAVQRTAVKNVNVSLHRQLSGTLLATMVHHTTGSGNNSSLLCLARCSADFNKEPVMLAVTIIFVDDRPVSGMVKALTAA